MPKHYVPRPDVHRFPTTGGGTHSYLLDRVPRSVWDRARRRARAEGRTMRLVVCALLEAYGDEAVDVPDQETTAGGD